MSKFQSLYLFPMQFVIWYGLLTVTISMYSIFGPPARTILVLYVVLFLPFLFFVGIAAIQSRLPA